MPHSPLNTAPSPNATGPERWRIYADTGGTFTDCLAVAPNGENHRLKILSSSAIRGILNEWRSDGTCALILTGNPAPRSLLGLGLKTISGTDLGRIRRASGIPGGVEISLDSVSVAVQPGLVEISSPEPAPIFAARLLTGTSTADRLPPIDLRLATTRGTNALLERRGGPLALIVTEGFADLLRIGTQQRTELFTLTPSRPEPLYDQVFELPGRLDSEGREIVPVDFDAVDQIGRALIGAGNPNTVVALLNSYRNPAHEQSVAERLRRNGIEAIGLSTEISPASHYLDRTSSTVVDGYLDPVIGRYLDNVLEAVDPGSSSGSVRVMTSGGGLAKPSVYRPSDSLLSGPAAGLTGAVHAARAAGFDRVITFDMGGTSTDVALFDQQFEYAWRQTVGDHSVRTPGLAIETVAAGGGSVCRWVADSLSVGPESAGAVPGPACYGAGGPLTITDCNVLTGRVRPESFGIPASREAAESAIRRLRAEMGTAAPGKAQELAEGLIRIADQRMAGAIRKVSVERGHDPSDYTLVAFGGAGGQHACGVAEMLGIHTILIPPDPSILSTRGLAVASIERIHEQEIRRRIGTDPEWIHTLFADMQRVAILDLAAEYELDPALVTVHGRAELRIQGQESTLSIEFGNELVERFLYRYQETFGYVPDSPMEEIEVESIRAIARFTPSDTDLTSPSLPSVEPSNTRTPAWLSGRWRQIPVCRPASLAEAERSGPALIEVADSTILLATGWTARLTADGIILRNTDPLPRSLAADSHATIEAELYAGSFQTIVDEMGEQLRRTAMSVNIRERMDFSCALLDHRGELVINAPHVPVHLGALGECVRSVVSAMPMSAGDVVVTNHPAFGGSHLPDITVITPLFYNSEVPIAYLVNRAHHAEIGGSRPGSMPPAADSLEQEGVVLPPMLVADCNGFRWDRIRSHFETAKYPSRDFSTNLADLRAQIAANRHGERQLLDLIDRGGLETFSANLEAQTRRAERLARAAFATLDGVDTRAEERLDDGSRLSVRLTVEGGEATLDFSGSSGVHPGNLNATPAIVSSVVVYFIRLLIDQQIPLNDGLMRPVRLILPPGLLNPFFGSEPGRSPAVVGGNTEISQRLVDLMIRTLELAACSQGTMNNVLWGNEKFGYYETIGGGAGASRDGDGLSGVHTHMTNTRITDAEILEQRYPVRLWRFEIRRQSGGQGRFHGGDGLRREIEFLAPVSLSILSQHRKEKPYGLKGGGAGMPGRQWIVRANGEKVDLAGIDSAEMNVGDRLIVETPGGGGWGRAGSS